MFCMQLRFRYGSPVKEEINALCSEDEVQHTDPIGSGVVFGMLSDRQHGAEFEDFYCKGESL